MDLTARAGLTLVSEAMLALGLDEVVRRQLSLRRRQRGFSEFDKLHAVVLMQAAGRVRRRRGGAFPRRRFASSGWEALAFS